MSAVSSCEMVAISSEPTRIWAMFCASATRSLLRGEDGGGGVRRLRPALAELLEAALQFVAWWPREGTSTPNAKPPFAQHAEIVGELVAAVLHLREGRRLAPRGEARGLGEALRVVLHLRRPPSRRSRSATAPCVSTNTISAVRATSPSATVPRMFICVVTGRWPISGRRETCPGSMRLAAGAGFFARGAALVDVADRRAAGRFVIVDEAAEAGRAPAFGLGAVRLPEPVRERCLGFCRWCFGHVVLRAA